MTEWTDKMSRMNDGYLIINAKNNIKYFHRIQAYWANNNLLK